MPLSNIQILSGGAELIDRVEALWLELRAHHAELSPTWRRELTAATWERRRDELTSKAANGLLVLLAIVDARAIGYCVATVNAERQGEVDSLYVTDSHRRHGIGRALLTESLRWLESLATGPIAVDVLHGNDDALRLYASFGFHARTVRLYRRPPGDELARREDWLVEYTERVNARPRDLPLRCPCCGCKTLSERTRFEICEVCFWEDDGQDDADADECRGGPNGSLSLREARENYRQFGACEARMVENVRPPRREELP